VCAWSSCAGSILASGGRDTTTRIWKLASTSRSEEIDEPIVMNYDKENPTDKQVTTIDWNVSGSYLATGYYNGNARVWSIKGELKSELKLHSLAILALKWNKKGNTILSSSMDGTVCLWDPVSNKKKSLRLHTDVVLDVDWVDNSIFLTVSKDKQIHLCSVDKTSPIKTFLGHEDEVNTIRWDPITGYFASGSDDGTAKIWSMDSTNPLHSFAHDRGIFSLRWCPTPSKNSNAPRILATASFDLLVRLWDVNSGTCLHKFANEDTVHSIAFTPDGKYIATGSFDTTVKIWNVKVGNLI